MNLDMRPDAVLSVGITRHRNLDADRQSFAAAQAAIEDIFRRLSTALSTAVSEDAAYFSAEVPILRVITMAAQGADLAAAQAAVVCGAELSCVLPFQVDEYLKDFLPTLRPWRKRL